MNDCNSICIRYNGPAAPATGAQSAQRAPSLKPEHFASPEPPSMRLSAALPLRVKLAGPAASGEFSGVAATWEVDRDGERFARGAFAKSLADWQARGAYPPLLWQHDKTEPVGAVISAAETDAGLEVTGRLALGTSTGRRAHELLKTGPGTLALSVGFAPKRESGGVFSEVDWVELSLVSVPAQPGAVVTAVKALGDRFPDRKSFEHAARSALGLSANEAKRLAAGGWAALARAEDETETDPNAAAIAAALRRIIDLRT